MKYNFNDTLKIQDIDVIGRPQATIDTGIIYYLIDISNMVTRATYGFGYCQEVQDKWDESRKKNPHQPAINYNVRDPLLIGHWYYWVPEHKLSLISIDEVVNSEMSKEIQ